MKANVANHSRQTLPLSPKARKRTSLEADRELAHIHAVLRTESASTTAALPISAWYWRARLRELRIDYALLPVQLALLSTLELCVDSIEQAAREIRPAHSRRVT
jgi:hypothetical protein